MSCERDFEGIPLEGKHTIYSFLFMLNNNIDKKNYTYETMCDKELTAKRRYARYLKKLSEKTCNIIKEQEVILDVCEPPNQQMYFKNPDSSLCPAYHPPNFLNFG